MKISAGLLLGLVLVLLLGDLAVWNRRSPENESPGEPPIAPGSSAQRAVEPLPAIPSEDASSDVGAAATESAKERRTAWPASWGSPDPQEPPDPLELEPWTDGFRLARRLISKRGLDAFLDDERVNPEGRVVPQDERTRIREVLSPALDRLKETLKARDDSMNALTERKWQQGDGQVLTYDRRRGSDGSMVGEMSSESAALMEQELRPEQWPVLRSSEGRSLLIVNEWGEDPVVDQSRLRLRRETQDLLRRLRDQIAGR